MLLVDPEVFGVLCNNIKWYFSMQQNQSNLLHHLERCSIFLICMILSIYDLCLLENLHLKTNNPNIFAGIPCKGVGVIKHFCMQLVY
jgi:hypothetical protein